MEIIIILASSILIFLSWQLYQAKRIRHFKKWIDTNITSELIHQLTEQLSNNRSEQFPNNDIHIEASILFWTQYRARIIQKSIQLNITNKQAIINMGFHRQCQHILFIEQAFLLPEEMLIPIDDIPCQKIIEETIY